MDSEINLDSFDKNKIKRAKEIIIENNLFDDEYYELNYPNTIAEADDLLEHYLTVGYKLGYDPSEEFNTNEYIKEHEQLRKYNINPLIYYAINNFDNNDDDGKSSGKSGDDDVELKGDIDDYITDNSLIRKYHESQDISEQNMDIAQLSVDINDKIKQLNEKSQVYVERFMQTNENVKEIYDENTSNSAIKTNNELTDDDIKKAKLLIEENNLFDPIYYNSCYPHVFEKNSDLLDHYLNEGYLKGFNPSEYFDTNFYMQYDDVKKSGMNPLIFYVLYDLGSERRTTNKVTPDDIQKAIDIIKDENLFDEKFYITQIPQLKDTSLDALMHYIIEGYKNNLNPSKNFNTLFYKMRYLEGSDDINPLVDYVLNHHDNETIFKLGESKINEYVELIYDSNRFDEKYYKDQTNLDMGDKALIKHYIIEGEMLGYNPNHEFDTKYYLENNSDVVLASANAFYHYLTKGISKGKHPIATKSEINKKQQQEDEYKRQAEIIEKSTLFDSEYYLKQYSDVKYTMQNPAYHYISRGYKESKNPSRYFDNNYYMYRYKHRRGVDINPLYHYIVEGENLGYASKYFYSDVDKKEAEIEINTDIISQSYPKYDSTAPKVSIIILNYNGEKYLKKLFDSIDESTNYPNYEVIVVENDSTDDSIDIICEYKEKLDLVVLKNRINKTYAQAYNDAIEYATGEYVIFMDNDIELLDGWLNHLIQTAQENENVGVVGAKLIYPDCSNSINNKGKSYKLQHTSVKFIQSGKYILPYNRDDGRVYRYNEHIIEEVPAVNGSLMLIRRDVFDEVGGFDEEYIYGYEAVDLSLRLYKKGYVNYYNSNAAAYHNNRATVDNRIEGLVNTQKALNNQHFAKKWQRWLKKEVLNDKIRCNRFFTEKPLKFTFITLEKGKYAVTGEYFIAQGLAEELENRGYEVNFISKSNDEDKFNIDCDVDVIISLVNSYNIDKIKVKNNLVIKIAWILNWPEWWINKSYFESYDLVLCSNSRSLHYINENSGYEAQLLAVATNPEKFNPDVKSREEFECDYIFAGNDWHDEREISEILNPDEIPYKFKIYGKRWQNFENLEKYNMGHQLYEIMPEVYASTKIIIDDATDLTEVPSGVNGRIFDGLASGKLVITNGEIGAKELFGDKLPVYHDADSLKEQIEFYLSEPELMDATVEELRSIVLKQHTYKVRADELIEILADFASKDRIIIKYPTPRAQNKYHWGDYHFGLQLQKEFNLHGYPSRLQLHDDWRNNTDALYDIVLVLRGTGLYEPKPSHYNILWNISHPNRVSVGEYNSFDKVYISSNYWTEKIKPVLDVDVEALLQCTNPQRFHRHYDEHYKSQLLFVGNSRMIYRKILHDLLPTDYDLQIYGNNWEGILDDKYITDNYIPNEEVYRAYSSCDVLLNDHWDDMLEKGFISNRIFDALACGATIVSDHVKGIEDVFGDSVIVYEDKEDLPAKIEEALNREPVEVDVVAEHTYAKRVEKIIADYEEKINKK